MGLDETDDPGVRPAAQVASEPPVVAPGKYRYSTTITAESDEFEDLPDSGWDVVHQYLTPEAEGSVVRQVRRDKRQWETRIDTFVWSREALVWLERVVVQRDPGGGTVQHNCTFRTPYIMMRFPIQVGDKWEAKSGGCPEGYRGPLHAAPGDTVFEVLREDVVEVAGRSVDAFVVHRLATMRTSRGEARDEGDQWFAPAYGLVVRLTNVHTSPAQAVTYEERTLLNLTPD